MTIFTGYHTSKAKDLKKFDASFNKKGDFGPGFYLSSTQDGSFGYGETPYRVEVEIKSPLIVDDEQESKNLALKLAERLKIDREFLTDEEHPYITVMDLAKEVYAPEGIQKVIASFGHDGIIVKQSILKKMGRPATGDYIIFFDPDQVRAMTNMSGQDILNDSLIDKIVELLSKNYQMTSKEIYNSLIDARAINQMSSEHALLLKKTLEKLVGETKIKNEDGFYRLMK